MKKRRTCSQTTSWSATTQSIPVHSDPPPHPVHSDAPHLIPHPNQRHRNDPASFSHTHPTPQPAITSLRVLELNAGCVWSWCMLSLMVVVGGGRAWVGGCEGFRGKLRCVAHPHSTNTRSSQHKPTQAAANTNQHKQQPASSHAVGIIPPCGGVRGGARVKDTSKWASWPRTRNLTTRRAMSAAQPRTLKHKHF